MGAYTLYRDARTACKDAVTFFQLPNRLAPIFQLQVTLPFDYEAITSRAEQSVCDLVNWMSSTTLTFNGFCFFIQIACKVGLTETTSSRKVSLQ
jgi:hypothetical protein